MAPLEHYQARSETVDSERYCSHLTDELGICEDNIKKNLQRMRRKGVAWFHQALN